MTDEKIEEKRLFQEVLDNLAGVESWFDELFEQPITFNREGFESARNAAAEFAEVVRTQADIYFTIESPTKENFEAFKQAVDASHMKNKEVIMANHDMSHDVYRGLQVAFKSVLDSLQTFFDYVAKKMGYEKGPTNLSDVVQPEDTTRSLYDKSIKHLVNFFNPKSKGDDAGQQEQQHGQQQDKKRDN